ncbi:uncharacterized protein L201_001273 [Kwoniella dendrophila CBS 6074]|uniref:DFDF domain-containing protein n=1 Tax=Kwoniella dendrophila CBS 6074 TaxID=1295534 RepID=A0AAX4JNJ4_9TREE
MDLEASGLPMSFGKQTPSLPTKPSGQSDNRGESSGRGYRGIVGGGKRNRGRGRGGMHGGAYHGGPEGNPNGVPVGPPQSGFAGGLKRPHPTSPNDNTSSSHQNVPPNFRHNQPFSNRGAGRGRGGGPRIHQGDGNGRNGGDRGFWKDSFLEDPWKELEDKRARKPSVPQIRN